MTTPEAIANILDARGSVSGYGKPFTGRMINRVRVKYGLKSRFERLRATGMLTREEMAQRLGINPKQVAAWRAAGLLRGHLCIEKDEYLYEDPGARSSANQEALIAASENAVLGGEIGTQREISDLRERVTRIEDQLCTLRQ